MPLDAVAFNYVPAMGLFAAGVLATVVRAGALATGLILLLSVLLMVLSAVLGLALNLIKPNLDWTNETIPVKQGLPVVLCLFGFWVLAIVMGGLYYLLYRFVSPLSYLLLWSALLLAADALLLAWLKKRGSAIFASL